MKTFIQLNRAVLLLDVIAVIAIISSMYLNSPMLFIMILLIYISLMQIVYFYNFPVKMEDKWVLMQSGTYQGYIVVPTYASSYSPYNTAIGNTTPYVSGSIVSAKRLSQIKKMRQQYANTQINQSYYGKITL